MLFKKQKEKLLYKLKPLNITKLIKDIVTSSLEENYRPTRTPNMKHQKNKSAKELELY